MKTDDGFKESEKLLNELEKKIHKEYAQASKEMGEKVDAYFAKFEKQNAKMEQAVNQGRMSAKDYNEWRLRKMATGKRYIAMRNTLAKDLTNTDKIAMKIVNQALPDVYALNMNYGTYAIEKDSKINTSFTLYNHAAVERLIKDNPKLLPSPKVDIPKDLRWNQQHIQSAITQGILQGKSIPQIAKNLQNVTGMDERAAIRNARTAMTGAQNAGRLDSMKRAAARGIGVKKGWLSTLDNVTRDSHVDLDGEVQEIDRPFSNGLMYPADASGAPAEVYNCRCRLTHEYDKYKTDWSNPANRNTSKLGNMTYQEWKNKHKQNVVVAKGVSKTIRSNEEYEKESVKILRDIYEKHRIQNNMVSVPADELPDDFFEKVNYGNIDAESAKVFNDTIANLSQRYDTTLAEIRLMSKEEFLQRNGSFAFTYHSYETDVSTLVINPVKSGKYEKMVERITELVNNNYAVKIDETLVNQYVATHEFAHTLLDMQTPLDAKRNFVGADYAKIKEARKEVEKVYSDYLKNMEALEKEYKKNELDFLNTFSQESADKAREYKEKLDAMTISKYANVDSDEFMAECFTHKQLGGKENEYVDRIMEIIDKHFGR
jgi:SPP1 gp7 family putative phage head morphogenesis protein